MINCHTCFFEVKPDIKMNMPQKVRQYLGHFLEKNPIFQIEKLFWLVFNKTLILNLPSFLYKHFFY